ncbi:MAG TPA: hypothetical protein VGB37_00250 [Candidatus Lokiarchaeia archaeon]
MTREELLPYVGKFCYIDFKNDTCSGHGFIAIHKTEDLVSIESFVRGEFVGTEIEILEEINLFSISFLEINNIRKEINTYNWISIHEYFGHELEGWLSKPIDYLSVFMEKYPHTCMRCSSPSWINPVTGYTDCSNKNCR